MNRRMLITGGAGFIGVNAAIYFTDRNWDVTIIDNLSREGTELNLEWIQKHGDGTFLKIDIRNKADVYKVFEKNTFDVVLHLAAQVAVTTSVADPAGDFDINALGTFNILEGIRNFNSKAFLIYASTNKVYGGMEDLCVIENNGRYEYEKLKYGVDESRNLDFHSPYGCSKGAADQYVIDYSRIYDLQTVSLRQSCIYGQRQFGIEDQGWVAWFTIASVLGKPIPYTETENKFEIFSTLTIS